MNKRKLSNQHLSELRESKEAIKRARDILNYQKPQHPPNIYFIRRKPQLMNKYLDPKEMDQIVQEVPDDLKHNYQLFKITAEEKKIQDEVAA